MLHKDVIVTLLTSALPKLVAIYGFGSHGTKFERFDSDIDLAVLAESSLEPVMLWNLAQELSAHLHRDVDLLDLRSVSAVMRLEVVAHGERMFCKDKFACDFYEVVAYKEYARLNEERQEILKDIRERGHVYG